MRAIYQYFGYDLPLKERFALMKQAGFDAVGLWSDADWQDEAKRRQCVKMAHAAGLAAIDAHAPRKAGFADAIWLDTLDGETTYDIYHRAILTCGEDGVKNLVVHIETDRRTPPPNALGVSRIRRLLDLAEGCGVTIALENIRNHSYLSYVFQRVDSPNLGFCYDAGHWNCNEPTVDFIALYGDKLVALHLHDNDGRRDQHLLPFMGNVNWEAQMEKIRATGYQGPITLESGLGGLWKAVPEDAPPAEVWLREANAAARRLEAMMLT